MLQSGGNLSGLYKYSFILFLAVASFFWSGAVWAANPANTPPAETVNNEDAPLPENELYPIKGEGYDPAPDLSSDDGNVASKAFPTLVSLNDQPAKSEPAAWAAMWPWLMLGLSIVSLLGYGWSLRQGLLARWR